MYHLGEVFENRYVVERELGQGAFAIVYLARAHEGYLVAIKVLKDGRSDDRFFREAKLLSELRSPHTVTLLQSGRTSTHDRRPFMVFEYVHGQTLEERLARGGPMPGGRVAHIIRQVLASLAEAHQRGIVHRDVKPANIMLTDFNGDEDFVKVLDFGVAKPMRDVRDVSVELTMAGQIIGTMRYMAPEQLRGDRRAIPASDVYAVGLIAYELLTGRKAAVGEDAHEVLAQHLSNEPFILSDHLAIPFTFKRAFESMMSKDLRLRPRDAGEALRTLDFVDDEPTTFDNRHDEPQSALDRGWQRTSASETVDEPLRIDMQALQENRARVTRGMTAVPQKPAEADVPTWLYVLVGALVFVAVILLLMQLA